MNTSNRNFVEIAMKDINDLGYEVEHKWSRGMSLTPTRWNIFLYVRGKGPCILYDTYVTFDYEIWMKQFDKYVYIKSQWCH